MGVASWNPLGKHLRQRIQWSRKVWLGYYRLRDRLSTCIANSVAQCRSTCRFIFAHYSAWLLQSLVSYSPKQTCGAAQHLPHHVLIHTVALVSNMWFIGHCSMQSHINIYYTLPIGAEVINSTAPEKKITFHTGAV